MSSEAATECRKACKESQPGDVMQHIHHERWLEILTEPVENRIAFILSNKAIPEQVERLRRLRPFEWKRADAEWERAYAEWERAYAEWERANAEWKRAYAEWERANAKWKRAYAEWKRAYAEWERADASLEMLNLHAEICGCPWDATHDIFGQERQVSGAV